MNTVDHDRSRRFTASLASVVLVDTIGYALVMPLLPFATQHGGASIAGIGFVFATYSLCQLVAAPVLGRLADRFGRQPILIASLLGSAAGFAILVISQSLFAIFASRVVDGLSAGNIAIVNAMLIDRTAKSRLGPRLAMVNAAVGIGILAGLIGSAFAATHGLALAAAIAGCLSLVNIVCALVIGETRDASSLRIPSPFFVLLRGAQFSATRRAWLVALIAAIAQASVVLVLPIYIVRVVGGTITAAIALIALLVGCAAFFQVLVVPVAARRFTPAICAAGGFALIAAGGGVAAMASSLAAVVVAGLLALFGGVTLLPATTALLGSARPGDGGEGVLMGLNSSAVSTGQLVGPLIGYAALAAGGPLGFGLACSAIALTGVAAIGITT